MGFLCQMSIFLPYHDANVYIIFEITSKMKGKFGKQ